MRFILIRELIVHEAITFELMYWEKADSGIVGMKHVTYL